jgi:hypothetical protein
MSRLTKYIATTLMLIVMCISTGNAFFTTAEDDCCHTAVTMTDDCDDEGDQDCSNSGNPFQSCGCCLHALIPSQPVAFQSASYPPAISFLQHPQEILSNAYRPDFWQPPRFS